MRLSKNLQNWSYDKSIPSYIYIYIYGNWYFHHRILKMCDIIQSNYFLAEKSDYRSIFVWFLTDFQFFKIRINKNIILTGALSIVFKIFFQNAKAINNFWNESIYDCYEWCFNIILVTKQYWLYWSLIFP